MVITSRFGTGYMLPIEGNATPAAGVRLHGVRWLTCSGNWGTSRSITVKAVPTALS